MSGSSDCSIGRNGLTSPPDGLIVPTRGDDDQHRERRRQAEGQPGRDHHEGDDPEQPNPVEVAAAEAEERG